MKLIVSGTERQYRQWLAEEARAGRIYTQQTCRYVSHRLDLLGIGRALDVELLFIDTWYERSDLAEIEDLARVLVLAGARHDNPSL